MLRQSQNFLKINENRQKKKIIENLWKIRKVSEKIRPKIMLKHLYGLIFFVHKNS